MNTMTEVTAAIERIRRVETGEPAMSVYAGQCSTEEGADYLLQGDYIRLAHEYMGLTAYVVRERFNRELQARKLESG